MKVRLTCISMLFVALLGLSQAGDAAPTESQAKETIALIGTAISAIHSGLASQRWDIRLSMDPATRKVTRSKLF
jgi:hypothetical protein